MDYFCYTVSAPNFQQTEIVTSAGQLPCGIIIHIMGRNKPSEIKDVVLSVLKMCEANQLSSVAFPALGTGNICVFLWLNLMIKHEILELHSKSMQLKNDLQSCTTMNCNNNNKY